MRPNTVESLRGIQHGLAAALTPDAGEAFAQDAVRTSQMLLESLIGELTAPASAPDADDATVREILARGAGAVRDLDGALAAEIASALGDASGERLAALFERLLVVCEDAAGGGGASEELLAARADAYRHLRDVAARGWSFWDMASFRERMARLRAEGT